MRRTSFEEMHCSVAQTLEVVGEWWTLLIVRDLLLGVTRFDTFQERLGISRNILADRLETLVAHDIVEKVPYQERPVRYDYRLTAKGRDLWTVVTALREWGDRWVAPDGPPAEMVHRTCGHVAHVDPRCDHCGEPLTGAVTMRPGPGAGADPVAGTAPNRD
ncbi:MAG: helix-turn-helix domain-containing protein [Actinomycetota bacterium]|nr:helix-turn-helix domain-containing protein [Actinomycetota bacterium]